MNFDPKKVGQVIEREVTHTTCSFSKNASPHYISSYIQKLQKTIGIFEKKHLCQCGFFLAENCWHFSFYPFIITVHTRHLVRFVSSFLAPGPPRNSGNPTHRTHFDLPRSEDFSRDRDQALGKNCWKLIPVVMDDFERLEM